MNWVRKRLVLEAQAPLLITENPGAANVIRSLAYVSGTMLRGALAQRYLTNGGTATDSLFQRMFLQDECYFGNLLVDGGLTPTFVLPLTASTCKDYPGFQADGPSGHGARDLLADLWCLPASPRLVSDLCGLNGCQAPWDRLPGFAAWVPRYSRFRRVAVPGYRRGHTEVMDRLQSAQAAALFFHEMLSEGTCFAGVVRCSHDLLGELQTLMADTLTLGAARSRGLGLCSVKSWEDPDAGDPLVDRLRWWHERCEEGVDRPWTSLVLTCASDVLLRDAAGRYTTNGLAGAVASSVAATDEKAAAALSEWVVAFSQFRVRRVPGWQASWGTPKEEAWAIAAGSAFVLRGSSVALCDVRVLRALETLELVGVGERRSEGFGELSVCHPFHSRRGPGPDGRY